ncbi:Pin2-interacting protein X1 [Harpegnathos saltator]|uniref:Pin2-interacting protein X1 n=1 Tax=Harpegnathos saltator TaxID=610380 RepID=E2C7C0_HARSA|nr:Pin2-interacting protein X1 [Harpegnathos saltator]
MSMLAESRRKKKWSIDPQGKRWSKDNDKIGQKMLEKMGWTSGKGLGINEQGITEHVRVNKRNPESERAGYNNLYMQDIHEHQDKFNEFLQQLANHHNQEETIEKLESNEDLTRQSLELKSKQSCARLHYQKFTRGKDVSKYSTKDLANIFGKKELTSKTEVEEDNNICENEAIDTKDKWGGVFTINSGSMADYFKQKLQKDLASNIIDNQRANSESETEQYVGFGFTSKTENILSNGIPKNKNEKSNYAFDNPCLRLNSFPETMLNTEDSSKKNKEKRKKEFVSESIDLYVDEANQVNARKKLKIEIIDSNSKEGFMNPALNLDTKPDEDCNGKEFEVSRAQFGLENCGLDLTDEKSNKKRVTFNDHVEYSIDVTKRKKGKATLDKFEVENKKHKKKRQYEDVTTLSNGFVNEALDVEISSAEINDNELNEHKSTKIKKRKVRKTSNLETIQESPEQEKEIIEIKLEEDTTLDISSAENKEIDSVNKNSEKKKKKKKEVKIIDNDIITTVENEKSDKKITYGTHSKEKEKDKEEYEIVSKEVLEKSEKGQQQTDHLVNIKKKKSKKRETIIKDPTTVETSLVVTTSKEKSVLLEEKSTVKKKKKKHNSKDNYLENEINMCDMEQEISDKENTVEEQKSNTKLQKKDKKHKRSKDTLGTKSFTNHSVDVTDVNVISNQENVDNAEFIDIPPKRNQAIDSINNVICSPWNRKTRMTKKILKRLFYGNLIANFPGSNVQEIKGYGVDINGN